MRYCRRCGDVIHHPVDTVCPKCLVGAAKSEVIFKQYLKWVGWTALAVVGIAVITALTLRLISDMINA